MENYLLRSQSFDGCSCTLRPNIERKDDFFKLADGLTLVYREGMEIRDTRREPQAAAKSVRRRRSGRPAEKLVTRHAAAAVALSLIDRDGLDALSLPNVARVLGVSGPSLYHHFRDKRELLVEIARLMLQEVIHQNGKLSQDWETRVVEFALAIRRVSMRHPNAAPLGLRYFARNLMLKGFADTLKLSPYSPETYPIILECIGKLTYGAAHYAAANIAHDTWAVPAPGEEQFVDLSELNINPFDEGIFVTSLQLILKGFRTSLAAKD